MNHKKHKNHKNLKYNDPILINVDITENINKMNTLNDLEISLSDLELLHFNDLQKCKFYNYFKKKNLINQINIIKIQRQKYKKEKVILRKNHGI